MSKFFTAVGGALVRPYDAMSELVERRDWATGIAVPTVALIFLIVAWVVLPPALIAPRALLVVWSFVLFGGTFVAAAAVIHWVCRLVGGNSEWRSTLAAWGLTYVPTGGWFLMMILGHFVAPGPQPFMGTFQVVFAVLSLAFFLWKLLLYYFALRLAGRLSFPQIVKATFILAPIAVIYWLAGLYLGLFKVPFI